MRLRRSVVPLSGALLAGLAISGGPAGADAGPDSVAERPGASAAEITKIKIILGRRRNTIYGAVYSHNPGCVGARRARVFAVNGGRKRLLDTDRSARYRTIGYFRLGLGRFKWNQTYRIVTAPRRVGRLRCEGDRQTYRVNCLPDAVLDIGLPTTNCYPLPTGPPALEGNVTTTYTTQGITQVLTAAVRLTRIDDPADLNVQGQMHYATLAYKTAPGTLNWTESGVHNPGTGCTHQGSGQVAVGPKFPDSASRPPDPAWARLVFELGTRHFGPGIRYHVESLHYHYGDITWTCHGVPRPSVTRIYPGWFDFSGGLYDDGSEFGPGVHTETVREDSTLGGVHNLEGVEGGGNSDSTARVEWNLRPVQ